MIIQTNARTLTDNLYTNPPSAADPMARRSRKSIRRHRRYAALASLGLTVAFSPAALAVPLAQLVVSHTKVPTSVLSYSCCYKLALSQKWGLPGDLVKVTLTPITLGVTVTSATDSVSGATIIVGNVATWVGPSTSYLGEEVTVCFSGASGPFVVKVVAEDAWGNTGFKMSHYLAMECSGFSVSSGATIGSPISGLTGGGGGVPAGNKTPSGVTGPIGGGQVGSSHSGPTGKPFVDMWQDQNHAVFLAIGDPDGMDDVDMNSLFVAFNGVPMPPQAFLSLFTVDDRGSFYQVRKSTQIMTQPGMVLKIQVAVRDQQGNVFVGEFDYIGM